MNQISFINKTVIITGASSGIGAGAAKAFAKLGANLVLTGRNVENLQSIKEQCLKEGLSDKQVVLTSGDIADTKCQKELIDAAIANFGQIDVLINNAGAGNNEVAPNFSMEIFDKTHQVNLRAPVALSTYALPHLMKTKGNIVNVSSIGAYMPITGALSYCVSKAGLDMLTKSLAIEMGAYGVRVNSVNPGYVRTNIMRDFPPEQAKAAFDDMAKLHVIGRIGEVEEIANAIVFLASDKAAFITGDLLGIHGGAGIGRISFDV